MIIVHVNIHVKPEYRDAFIAATLVNAQNSVQEAGIARFDFIQQQDDPNRFVLVEIYQSPADADLHKATAHYQIWRDTVTEMMAEPRQGVKYNALFPTEFSAFKSS
ncbi:MAG: antibiotic biosynthesis monooxygenase [Chloroflexi bacterium]|nr:antibiotic biosynthesis monooxygenase [Chloroflexota bacterium]